MVIWEEATRGFSWVASMPETWRVPSERITCLRGRDVVNSNGD